MYVIAQIGKFPLILMRQMTLTLTEPAVVLIDLNDFFQYCATNTIEETQLGMHVRMHNHE